MTALEKWKNDFKEFISELSMPRDDYKGIMEYIDEVPNEALEQQPCDDCISRQAVLDKLNRLIEVERLQGTDEMGYGRERVSAYECMIHSIKSEYLYPSVNPQQPCEDCISRQAVDELSKELVHTTRDKADFLCNFWEGLQKLPSVTPKEKTGKWIRWYETIEQEHCTIHDPHCKCSECNQEYDPYIASLFNHCPNCGAKMIEPTGK